MQKNEVKWNGENVPILLVKFWSFSRGKFDILNDKKLIYDEIFVYLFLNS